MTVAVPSVFEAALPRLATMTPDYDADPHAHHRAALEQGPISMGTFGPEALSYEAVHAVLRDRRFRMPSGLALELQGITSGPVWDRATRSILALDGEPHQRLRRLVVKAFMPRATERLRPTMLQVINEILDGVTPSGRCDVVSDVARSYPTAVVCELLGAPRRDVHFFAAWADDIFKILGFNVAEDTPDILRAFEQFDAYIDRMVTDRRTRLTDDLLSDLIRAEEEGERLSHEELRMLAGAILSAGTDTTRNQLAAAVQVFADHPEQWELLAREPELAPAAVEEVMRHSPAIFGTMRVAAEDVELCGVVIPAGTVIGAMTSAANRDPAVFPEPEVFDITRKPDAPMLTFGGGVHYCLGVHLAKAELAEALAVMARRMPALTRVGPAPWKPTFGISGPRSLPIRFDPGR